jgi:hypothetical protein
MNWHFPALFQDEYLGLNWILPCYFDQLQPSLQYWEDKYTSFNYHHSMTDKDDHFE